MKNKRDNQHISNTSSKKAFSGSTAGKGFSTKDKSSAHKSKGTAEQVAQGRKQGKSPLSPLRKGGDVTAPSRAEGKAPQSHHRHLEGAAVPGKFSAGSGTDRQRTAAGTQRTAEGPRSAKSPLSPLRKGGDVTAPSRAEGKTTQSHHPNLEGAAATFSAGADRKRAAAGSDRQRTAASSQRTAKSPLSPLRKGGDATAPSRAEGKRPAQRVSVSHETGLRHGHADAKHQEQRPKLHSGQTVELTIIGTNDEGFGIAAHEGTRVLVAGALPGEVLVARVTYVGRREAFANIIKTLKISPDRETAPACGMGRACDGCGLMQMRYPAQLAWKKNLVTKEFAKHPSLAEAKIHETVASPKQLNYRNTAKLVIAGKHSDPVIGIYRRNTHDVLEIEDCQLHHPLINKVVKAAKQGIKKGKVPIYNPKSEMGLLRYLVVRVAEPSDQVMVVLVTSEQGYNEMHHLAKFIQQAVPEVAVVAQNINNSTGNVIFGHKDRFLTKAQTLRAYVGEKSFNLSPHSFFQVNSGAAHIIYQKVRELAQLSGTERVLDVYCGIGGISLYLADKAKEVVGIEFVEAAVADATQNAALNHADNCSFEAGDAARLIDEIGEEGGADLIVLNPPRKGCDLKVLKSVAAINPERIIYVSCSPETLARDLDILSGLGYRTVEVHPVDMFPQTVHVEDVALVVRNRH